MLPLAPASESWFGTLGSAERRCEMKTLLFRAQHVSSAECTFPTCVEARGCCSAGECGVRCDDTCAVQETSPVLACREDSELGNVRGTVGAHRCLAPIPLMFGL